jgi:hypothetical protein
LVATVASCGDGQDPWCDELESFRGLEQLSAAIVAGDGPSAREQLEDFGRLAQNSPEEISDDMAEIARVLEEAVEVAMAAEDSGDIENRRGAINQSLAAVPRNISAVSAWAEEECGIRLD